MKIIVINALEVTEDFSYLKHEFKKGDVIESPSKHLLVQNRKLENEATMSQAIQLSMYADVLRNEYYDVIRFIFDNYKNLSLIRIKQK